MIVVQLGRSEYYIDSVLFVFLIVLAYGSGDFLGLDDHMEINAPNYDSNLLTYWNFAISLKMSAKKLSFA